MKTHECPICRAPGVPARHATCVACWCLVPGRLRRRLLLTWPGRVKDPRAHHEALTELLTWARDYVSEPIR